MYSSCPNIIKHFVPLKFSESVLDSQPSSCYFAKPETKQQTSPLKNLKLKCVESAPKDFVLIFKNKSFKEYEAKKKVKYSGLIKLLKEKGDLKNKIFHNLVFVDEPISSSRNLMSREYLILGHQSFHSKQSIQTIKVRACTTEKQRNTENNFVRSKTTQINIRAASPAKDSHTKDTKQSVVSTVKDFRNVRYNSTRPNSLKVNQKLSHGEADRLINFKIRGIKAPHEETTEYFKRSKTDFQTWIPQKSIK